MINLLYNSSIKTFFSLVLRGSRGDEGEDGGRGPPYEDCPRGRTLEPGGRDVTIPVSHGLNIAPDTRIRPMRHPNFPIALVGFGLVTILGTTSPARGQQEDSGPPPGFVALFNGKDMAGWHGMPQLD